MTTISANTANNIRSKGPVDREAACRRVLRRRGFRLVALRASEPDPLAGYYVIVHSLLKAAVAVLDLEELCEWVAAAQDDSGALT